MKRRELEAALRQLPAPAPRPDLLQRILHSRAMGRRITFPGREPTVAWRWAAAAAAAAVLIGGSWVISLSLSRIGASRGATDSFSELLRGTGLLPPPGDVPASAGMRRLQPKYALILSSSLDPSRLSEGLWTYRSTTTTDGILAEPSFIAAARSRVTRGSYEGRPAWVVTTALRSRKQQEPGSGRADTVYIDAATLRPRYAVAYGYKYRTQLVERFSGNRGFQSLTITGPMKGFYSGVMELPFPSDAIFTTDWPPQRLRVLLPAFPLARAWRGSMYQTGFFARTGPGTLIQHAMPVNIRVVGRDRVSVPAGRFDCWRVEVETYSGEQTVQWMLWVSRDKGWTVKAEFRGSDNVVTDVLESYEP